MEQPLELSQRLSFFRRLTLKVQGNRELVVTETGLFKAARFIIPLEQINPAPSQVRDLSVQWIVVTMIFGALTLWSLYVLLKGNPEPPAFILPIMMGGITFACYRNTARLSQNVVIFFSATTGNRILAVPRNRPSIEAVEAFVAQLRHRIESFRSPAGASRDQLVPLYRRHLEYLLSEAVLLPEEYEAAIARLVSAPTPSNVLELVR